VITPVETAPRSMHVIQILRLLYDLIGSKRTEVWAESQLATARELDDHEKSVHGLSEDKRLRHLAHMCQRAVALAGGSDAQRHQSTLDLGFIQGALWWAGISTLADLETMNRTIQSGALEVGEIEAPIAFGASASHERIGLVLTQELHPDPSHSNVLAPGETVDLHMVSKVELFGAEQLVIPSEISWKLRVDAILVDGCPQPLGNAHCPGRAQACRPEDVFQPVGAHVYNENGIGCTRAYDVGKTFVVRVTNRSDQAATLRAFVLGREAAPKSEGEPIVVQATNPSDQPATVQHSFTTYDVDSKVPVAPGFTRPMGVFVSKEPGRDLPALLTSQEERTTLLQGLQRGRKGYMYQVDSDLLMRVVLDAQAAHASIPVEGILSPRQQKGFRAILLRIASWTNARFDQHLRHEISDEDADAVLRFLGKLCVLPPECDPSGRLMGTKVPVLKPTPAVHEGAPTPAGSGAGFFRARPLDVSTGRPNAPRKDLSVEGVSPEAVDVGRAAYEAVNAAHDAARERVDNPREALSEALRKLLLTLIGAAEEADRNNLRRTPPTPYYLASQHRALASTLSVYAAIVREISDLDQRAFEKLTADVRRLEERVGLRTTAEKESP